MCKQLFSELFEASIIGITEPIIFIASRRETNRHLNRSFILSLDNVAKQHNISVQVEIKPHYDEKCLQIVDFIARAIFQRYEKQDMQYYDLISSLVTTEKPYTQRNPTM